METLNAIEKHYISGGTGGTCDCTCYFTHTYPEVKSYYMIEKYADEATCLTACNKGTSNPYITSSCTASAPSGIPIWGLGCIIIGVGALLGCVCGFKIGMDCYSNK